MDNLVSITLAVALLGAIVTLFTGRWPRATKWVALAASLLPLALATYALATIMMGTAPGGYGCQSAAGSGFVVTGAGYSYHECHEWIPSLGINVIFGLDGVSAPMFWLTSLLVTVGILFAWDETKRPNQFFGIAFWIGFSINTIVAELWLRQSRSSG